MPWPDVERRHRELQQEVQSRLDRTGKPAAAPLDLDTLKAEIERHLEFDHSAAT